MKHRFLLWMVTVSIVTTGHVADGRPDCGPGSKTGGKGHEPGETLDAAEDIMG